MPSQVGAVPTPSGETNPTPVITTRRRPLVMAVEGRTARSSSDLLFARGLGIGDGFAHPADLLGVLIRDFDSELLFERHHQLDDIQRVGAEVFREARVLPNFALLNAELLDDDALDL